MLGTFRMCPLNEDRKNLRLYSLEIRNPDASVTPFGSFKSINDQRARIVARTRIKRAQDVLNPDGDVILAVGGKGVRLTEGDRSTVEDLVLAALYIRR